MCVCVCVPVCVPDLVNFYIFKGSLYIYMHVCMCGCSRLSQ